MSPLAVLVALAPSLAPGLVPWIAQDPVPVVEPCRISGVIVDEAGQPLEGVRIALRGTTSPSTRTPSSGARSLGVHQGWRDPAPALTGVDGRYSLAFAPPEGFEFTLEATLDGHAKVAWRWVQLTPANEQDLGTVTLEREGLLVGYIMDVQGNLLSDGWSVLVSQPVVRGPRNRASWTTQANVDPDTGQFRIEGVAPGLLSVSAFAGEMKIEDVQVTTVAGEETVLELKYDGPDPARRLALAIGTQPFTAFRPELGTVHAIALDGARHELVRRPSRALDWQALDLEPGPYRIEIRDPRFVPWTQEGVLAGTSTSASLVGSAGLRLRVLEPVPTTPNDAPDADAPDADAIAAPAIREHELRAYGGEFEVDLRFRNVGFSPNLFRLPRPTGVDRALYRELVPGDLTLSVVAPGRPPAEVQIDALRPGELRTVDVVLMPGIPLTGRIVDAEGMPIAGLEVEATRGPLAGHDRPGDGVIRASALIGGKRESVDIGYRDAAAHTDADGRFVIEGLAAGQVTLRAARGPLVEAVMTVDHPTPTDLVLALPPSSLVSVRLLMPEGQTFENLALQTRKLGPRPSDPTHTLRHAGQNRSLWPLMPDGSLEPRYLECGRHNVNLVLAHAQGWNGLCAIASTVLDQSEQELVLDLREVMPESVHVSLNALPSGIPAAWWPEMHFEPTNGGNAGYSLKRGFGERANYVQITPGTYDVRLRAPGLDWTTTNPIEVRRGQGNAFGLAPPLHAQTLRILDAAGQPVADSYIGYWTADKQRGTSLTDLNGRVTLVLLEGTLSVALIPKAAQLTVRAQLERHSNITPTPVAKLLETLTAEATAEWRRPPQPDGVAVPAPELVLRLARD